MTFTESNTVEHLIDSVTQKRRVARLTVREAPPSRAASLGGDIRLASWAYVPPVEVPRRWGDVMVESWLRDVLIRVNPRSLPGRRGHLQPPRHPPRRAGRWPRAGKRERHDLAQGGEDLPSKKNGEHVLVRLIDAENPANNHLVVNGLPLIIGERPLPATS